MMSDRRPSKPKLSGEDIEAAVAAMPRWMAESIDEHVGDPKDVVSVILDAVDPVAAVRQGVESGTIKGEEVKLCQTHEGGVKTIGLTDERCHRRFGSVVPCEFDIALLISGLSLNEEKTEDQ